MPPKTEEKRCSTASGNDTKSYAFYLQVTAVHKANIMKLGDGLFLQCCRDVAALYPNIEFDQMIVDNTTMQLVSKPQQFDVMVRYIKYIILLTHKENIPQKISLI